MFAHDRDLLAIEPTVFRDNAWLSQRPLSATGNVSGTTLTLTSGSFAAAGILPGFVALIDQVPCEVVAIASATEATISLSRPSAADPPVPPPPKTGATVTIFTFRPQLSLAHGELMRELGLDGALPDTPGEEAILNIAALARVEAIGALSLVYAAASALAAPGSALQARAQSWQARYAAARREAQAILDLDGDGLPDSIRTIGTWSLTRA